MFQPQFIDNSVMRGRVHAISTLKGLVADLRFKKKRKTTGVNRVNS